MKQNLTFEDMVLGRFVDRICARLLEQRSATLGAEKMREDAARRSALGASTSTAVTLTTFIDEETDANLDFIHGEGYSAKKAAERAETARVNASRKRGYNRRAAANPKEASRPRTRQSSGRASKLDSGGY